MKFKVALFISAVAFVSGSTLAMVVSPILSPSKGTEEQESIVDIIDGDTLQIAAPWSPYGLEWKVRVRGIDAPEKGARAKCSPEKLRAARAEKMTEQLISQSDNQVILRNVDHDKYGGRLVADVILKDGSSLSEELISAKLAKRYNGSGPRPTWCF